MNHPASAPITILLAAICVAPACASPGDLLVQTGLPGAYWISPNGIAPEDGDESPALVATGDFNRDGIADMVQVTPPHGKGSGPHFLTILLGQGDGTFKTAASHSLIGEPRALVVGDFNHDGNPDVILGDGDGRLLEFLGDGKGDVTGAADIARLGSIVSIATGRFTRNGNLDIVVSDFVSNSAAVFLGAGDGSFRFTWSFPLPKQGTAFHLATADFNRDGLSDVAITTSEDDNYEVMLSNGNGTFTYAPDLSHLRDPNSYCPS